MKHAGMGWANGAVKGGNQHILALPAPNLLLLGNGRRSALRRRVATTRTPFVNFVSHIRRRVSQPQVPQARIGNTSYLIGAFVIVAGAGWLIARVTDHPTLRHRGTAGELPGKSMNAEQASTRLDESVALSVAHTHPQPAWSSPINAIGNTLRDGNYLSDIMAGNGTEDAPGPAIVVRFAKDRFAARGTSTLYEHQAPPGVGSGRWRPRRGTLLPSSIPATRRAA